MIPMSVGSSTLPTPSVWICQPDCESCQAKSEASSTPAESRPSVINTTANDAPVVSELLLAISLDWFGSEVAVAGSTGRSAADKLVVDPLASIVNVPEGDSVAASSVS